MAILDCRSLVLAIIATYSYLHAYKESHDYVICVVIIESHDKVETYARIHVAYAYMVT